VLPSKYDAAISLQSVMLPSATSFFTYQQLLQQASKQASNIKFVCAKRAAREQLQDPKFCAKTSADAAFQFR